MNNENSTFFSHLSLSMVEHNFRAVYDWNFKLLSVGTELVYFKCNFHQCTFNPNLLIYADNFLLAIFCCLDFEKRQKNRKWVQITPDSFNFESLNNWTEKTIAHKKTPMNISIYIWAVCIYDLFGNVNRLNEFLDLDWCSCFN